MSNGNTQTRFVVLALLVGMLSAVAGVALWTLSQRAQAPAFESLLVLPEPRVLGDFRLLDQNGDAFSLDDLRGRWSLLFFGFTHCPDICPSTMFDLQQIDRALAESGEASQVWQVVLVSVDPERDTPERMKDYVSWFDPEFLGVTGAAEQLKPLAMRIGVAYRIEEHAEGVTDYSVDHSASVFLTDPDGRLFGVFPAPHDAEAMTRDLARVFK